MAVGKIPFYKMNGCGNDFIVVDNRKGLMNSFSLPDFVRKVCARGKSVGADGFMMLEASRNADFTMRYFNADGSEGEMCGNGARCISRFAYLVGAAGQKMSFETLDGIYHADVDQHMVKVKFADINRSDLKLNQAYDRDEPAKIYHYGVVGVPHTVWLLDDLSAMEDGKVTEWGKRIRHDRNRFPNGTNVNFIEIRDRQTIKIRTYERGVEAETLACGSGSTAAAIIAGLLGHVEAPVDVYTRGGVLTISYCLTEELVTDIYMEGEARLVAEGELLPDAWL